MVGLIFHLSIHFILSIVAGFAVWKIWKKPIVAFMCAFFGGVLVDLDHLIDYFIAYGLNFKLSYFINGYQFLKNDKIYVLSHGWEYVIIFIVGSLILKNETVKTVFFALSLGLFFHLLVDTVLNNMTIRSYSAIYRAANNFDLKKVEKKHIFENSNVIIKR